MTTTPHRYLILHGLDGSPEGHWQHWLACQLRERGHEVSFPQMPSPSSPNLDYGNGLLHLELAQSVDTTLIAHSLGAYLWLRYASKRYAFPVKRALIVAPPSRSLIESCPRVAAARPFQLDGPKIRRSAGEILLVGSSADPYCPEGFEVEYATRLGIRFLATPASTGHINAESGFGPWNLALDWAVQPFKPRATYTLPPDQRSRKGEPSPCHA